MAGGDPSSGQAGPPSTHRRLGQPPAGPAALGVIAMLAACGGAEATRPLPGRPVGGLVTASVGSLGHVEVRQLDARPRLTLVTREGDPTPALVVAVATDLGPVATATLARVVEARVASAGFDVDTELDRDGFRLRWLVDGARGPSFIDAVSSAFARPIAPGAPELSAAASLLARLRKSPIDAPELDAVAACVGRLNIAAGDASFDPVARSTEVEAWRRAALTAARTSIATTGPTAFGHAIADALSRSRWPQGAPADDAMPATDSVKAFVAPSVPGRGARAFLAVRVADPRAAVAAAEELGERGSALEARLSALMPSWRPSEVLGVARPRGGCLAVTLEANELPATGQTTPIAAAIVVARAEMRLSLTSLVDASVATRQILTAADPRDAASRGAWWALSGAVPSGTSERWAIALGIGPTSNGKPRVDDPDARALAAEIDRAQAGIARSGAQRKTAVERGQGELWVLLASPCGCLEEGADDAGTTALAAAAAVHAHDPVLGVRVEPWVTPDGIGIVAHGTPRGPDEDASALGRRVADAAGRVLAATRPNDEGLLAARAAVLGRLEALGGRQGIALDTLTAALSPDHPSWISPLGTWSRVAGAGLDAVRLRWQALGQGPLRLAVLANADERQAALVGDAVDRWLGPRPSQGSCRATTPPHPRAGKLEVRLPRDARLSHLLLALSVPPPGAAGHEMAQILVAALEGEGGLLDRALTGGARPLAASWTVRLHGGGPATALVIDVRTAPDLLDAATTEVRTVVERLRQSGLSDADLTRAVTRAERRARDERADPQRRLVALWTGRTMSPPPKPSSAALRDWAAAALREDGEVVVQARPE